MNPEIVKLEKQIAEKRQTAEFVKINQEINNLQKIINNIKDSCPHKNNIKKYDGNSGNYDPSADIYWVDIECLDCGKRLHFYDHEEGYRKY
jgi:hypothetical protein